MTWSCQHDKTGHRKPGGPTSTSIGRPISTSTHKDILCPPPVLTAATDVSRICESQKKHGPRAYMGRSRHTFVQASDATSSAVPIGCSMGYWIMPSFSRPLPNPTSTISRMNSRSG